MLIETDRKIQMVLLIFIISMGVLYRLKLPIYVPRRKDQKILEQVLLKTILPFWLAPLAVAMLSYVYLSVSIKTILFEENKNF